MHASPIFISDLDVATAAGLGYIEPVYRRFRINGGHYHMGGPLDGMAVYA